jgi:hypothetical protein
MYIATNNKILIGPFGSQEEVETFIRQHGCVFNNEEVLTPNEYHEVAKFSEMTPETRTRLCDEAKAARRIKNRRNSSVTPVAN